LNVYGGLSQIQIILPHKIVVGHIVMSKCYSRLGVGTILNQDAKDVYNFYQGQQKKCNFFLG